MRKPEKLNALFIPCYVDGLPMHSGSVNWRCRWPAKYWSGLPAGGTWRPGNGDVYDGSQRPGDYQVVVFQKVYRSERARGWVLDLAKRRARIRDRTTVLVLDMCDPDWLDVGHRERLLPVLPLFDVATGSTMPLVNWLGQYLPAYEVADGIDLDELHFKHEQRTGSRPRICWIGYAGNIALETLAPDIQKLGVDVDVVEIDRPVPFTVFLKTLSRYDILLNPQPDRPPFNYKSSNKSDAAWMTGVAVAEKPGDLLFLVDPEVRLREIDRKQTEILSERTARRSAERLFEVVTGELNQRAVMTATRGG